MNERLLESWNPAIDNSANIVCPLEEQLVGTQNGVELPLVLEQELRCLITKII
ncbi:hypothetical protein Acid7E03_42420 [Acidisoma sp. 7E03]